MQAMLEAPDDPVAKFQAELLADLINVNVEGEDLTCGDMIANLPAEASVGSQNTDALDDGLFLLLQIIAKLDASFRIACRCCMEAR